MPTLTPEQQKENLSFGYLQTVSSVAGISLVKHDDDGDGIDGSLKYQTAQANLDFDFQLKSTSIGSTLIREQETYFNYDLKVKNYNDLRRLSVKRRYLFLLVVPEDFKDSVECSSEQLIVRKCMYWLNFSGLPDVDAQTTTVVRFPKENIVSPEWLRRTMSEIAEEL